MIFLIYMIGIRLTDKKGQNTLGCQGPRRRLHFDFVFSKDFKQKSFRAFFERSGGGFYPLFSDPHTHTRTHTECHFLIPPLVLGGAGSITCLVNKNGNKSNIHQHPRMNGRDESSTNRIFPSMDRSL